VDFSCAALEVQPASSAPATVLTNATLASLRSWNPMLCSFDFAGRYPETARPEKTLKWLPNGQRSGAAAASAATVGCSD
jgi:hypothetical protein